MQNALALLVVDDEVHVAGELADAAGEEGYVVHVANSVASARAAIAQFPQIGVMISDIRMPDGDGLELMKQVLVGREETEALEVILITGHATLSDAITAVRTGAFDFVRKPFRLREILDAISRALARSIGRRRIAEARRIPVPPEGVGMPAPGDVNHWPADVILHALMYELRTPLVPVLGFAELLETSRLPGETREYARQIGAGAKHLLRTVDDVITLSQLDRGLVQLSPCKTDASDLLRQAAETHGSAAVLSGVSLTVTGDACAELYADPVLIRRALDILLRVATQRAARGGFVVLSAVRSDAQSIVTLGLEAMGAVQRGDATPLDGMQTALQIAPLGMRFVDAVARLHHGDLLLPRSPVATFRAALALPTNPAVVGPLNESDRLREA